MTSITFDAITKRFASNTVIDDFSAHVEDNEFLVLLGPSGCGKSTLLRLIAGLTDISQGKLKFGNRVVNELDPKQRNIAFVFQSYALYPHMSVRDNIAFPLVMDNYSWWYHVPLIGTFGRRRLSARDDIAAKVDEVANLLELGDYLDRRPKALSGGQRQRVAVARSIVRDPDIYLFDEPLSNLDAKLRAQMRAEISALHARVKKTFIYVTHDQIEAMTMGSKIAVLNQGKIQQLASPEEIYEKPSNTFVARFIGSPPMNVFRVERQNDQLYFEQQEIAGSRSIVERMQRAGIDKADLGVRAERSTLSGDPQVSIVAHVVATEQLGAESIVAVKFGRSGMQAELGAAASRNLQYARIPGNCAFDFGVEVNFGFEADETHLFDVDTGKRIEE